MKIQDIRVGQKVLDGKGRTHLVDAVFSDGKVRDSKGKMLPAGDLRPDAAEPYLVTADDGTVSLRIGITQGFLKGLFEGRYRTGEGVRQKCRLPGLPAKGNGYRL